MGSDMCVEGEARRGWAEVGPRLGRGRFDSRVVSSAARTSFGAVKFVRRTEEKMCELSRQFQIRGMPFFLPMRDPVLWGRGKGGERG